MADPGTRSKATAERKEAVLAGLRRGLSRTVAAEAVGVSKDAIRRWTERSPRFADEVAQAEAQAQSLLLGLVLDAAAKRLPNTWQAAAWVLERRWPDAYGQRQRVEISMDIREEAERIAKELGLDASDVLAEAEGILASSRTGGLT